MDKLRKIGEMLWYNKERIVLAIMLIVLAWHVYRLFFPLPFMLKVEPHKHPCTENCELSHTEVPPPWDVRAMTSWKPAYTPNPFWYYATPMAQEKQEPQAKDAGITLLQIKEKGAGKYRAQLQTTVKKWCSEGDKLDQFEVRKIDADAETCDVFSERLGKVITLSVSGN